MEERERLEALIREAFAGVTREGGMSWRDALVADFHGDESFADFVDRDESWTDLVGDPLWNYDAGVGGSNFLDAIGFRYYLAAALVQEVRGAELETLPWRLTLGREHGWLLRKMRARLKEHILYQWSLLTPEQRRAIAEVVRWRAGQEEAPEDWSRAWVSYWKDLEL